MVISKARAFDGRPRLVALDGCVPVHNRQVVLELPQVARDGFAHVAVTEAPGVGFLYERGGHPPPVSLKPRQWKTSSAEFRALPTATIQDSGPKTRIGLGQRVG